MLGVLKKEKKLKMRMSNEVLLNCGIKIPIIGFGTYSFHNDRQKTELAVQMALKVYIISYHFIYIYDVSFFFFFFLFVGG